MNCQEVMDLMHRQLDGDLDESEYSVLIDHTRHCPDCAAMYDRLQLLSAELTSLPKVVPSYSLVDAILPELQRLDLEERNDSMYVVHKDEVEQEQGKLAARRLARSRRLPSLRYVGGIIAAGVVAGLFIIGYNAGIGPGFDNDSANSMTAQESASNDTMDIAQRSDVYSLKSDQKIEQDASAAEEDIESSGDSDGGAQPSVRTQGNEGSPAAGAPDQLDEATSSGEVGKQPIPESEPEMETSNTLESGALSGDGMSNKSGTDTFTSTPGTQGIMSEVPVAITAISPNGEWQAVAEGFKVKIFKAADQSLLFETDRKNGKLAGLVWSDDNTVLNYEVQLEQGASEKYVIDVKAGSDTKAQH
ncbi:anti-sigma factor family protein [Paenibacillus sp. 2TAB19]|uniref:anti-sigma factor family protein n=1 Tax=Paenibacillus sp. 2TAB19 TaxID=3233003 RepID=UPI003F964554